MLLNRRSDFFQASGDDRDGSERESYKYAGEVRTFGVGIVEIGIEVIGCAVDTDEQRTLDQKEGVHFANHRAEK